MKVYVIKNKEGKYLDFCQDFETNNICDARIFTYEEAVRFCPKNCRVVEITIVEGDLEQQLTEKDKEIYDLLDQNEEQTYKFANIVGETARLENVITEKDKQIKYLKDLCDKERLKTTELQQQIREEKAVFDMYRANTIQKGIADPEATKIIRHQVCDMARKKIVEATCYDTEEEVRNVIYDLNASEVLEILDQIERG